MDKKVSQAVLVLNKRVILPIMALNK